MRTRKGPDHPFGNTIFTKSVPDRSKRPGNRRRDVLPGAARSKGFAAETWPTETVCPGPIHPRNQHSGTEISIEILREPRYGESEPPAQRRRSPMKVAIPREIKNNEFRVAITPAGVHDLVGAGHEVYVEAGAGAGSSIPAELDAGAGATILPDAAAAWQGGEPIPQGKGPIGSGDRDFPPGMGG